MLFHPLLFLATKKDLEKGPTDRIERTQKKKSPFTPRLYGVESPKKRRGTCGDCKWGGKCDGSRVCPRS